MERFAGKIISVTGGGSGLGEAIVKRLASEGALVAVLDIDLTSAERLGLSC
jgi:NAD(P)-dependent dehydrogenase (short-subunit alcohol dehydrogenase family)